MGIAVDRRGLKVIQAAAAEQHEGSTSGIDDMAEYLSRQVSDESHREVSGPLLDGSGASGVIVHGDELIAQWGEVTVPEMLFSATKSVLSTVAGVAFDQGLLADLDTPVVASIELPVLSSTAHGRAITWKHLLQQTSQWDGELWGKPTRVDAQSRREGDEPEGGPPGSGWAYNDVRVNLVALALTVLLRRSLAEVLRVLAHFP